jgi:signal transduction histidine kinase
MHLQVAAGIVGQYAGQAVTRMRDELAHVALHDDRERIVEDAMRTARQLAGADSALAAVRSEDGDGFDMTGVDGVTEPGFRSLRIRMGLGLGGQVAAEAQPRALDDYVSESTITADYLPVVQREGLHGIACVPVFGPSGTEVLLYVSMHRPGAPGGVVMERLDRVASYTSIGLHHIAARPRERQLARLRERERLANALHDSVAQALFAIGIAAQRSRDASDPEVLSEQLERIEATAANARSELRDTLARLSRAPAGLGLEALIEAEIRLFERRTGRCVWITRHGEPRDLGAPSEELLVDTVREGLTNAHKHARGDGVLAHLAYGPEHVLLSLQSELGPPRSPEPELCTVLAIAPGSGLGLLRKRTRRLGGSLELTHDDDRTVLRVELPT